MHRAKNILFGRIKVTPYDALYNQAKRLLLIVSVVLCLTALYGAVPARKIIAQQMSPTPTTDVSTSNISLQHEVQAGETLLMIAKQYGITVAELMAENSLSDPDAIYIGQQLRLPASAAEQPTAEPPLIHEVQAGETLSEIAQQYDVSLTRLMLFNGLRDANAVVEGQELLIPPSPIEENMEIEETVETATPTSLPATATATPLSATPTPTMSSDTTEQRDAQTIATAQTTVPTGETMNNLPEQPVEQMVDIALIPDVRTDPALVDAQIASLNRTYTVVEGDTFPRIALRTGVDPEALRQLNRIDPGNLNELFIGQTLLLPAVGDDLLVRRAKQEYVVQPGDSLGSIANQYDLSLADILSANRFADPDTLSIGQRIAIPHATSTADEAADDGSSVGPARRGFYYYTVQPGDTLSELAKAFDSTKLALLEYNGLPDEETVYSGIELRIPYGPPTLPSRRPPVPSSGTSFVVSLSRQQCWLFHGNRVAREWTCSTGYGEWITRTGTFAVQSKIEVAKSNAYQLDMPYWLGIYNVGEFENGIHGLPVEWETGEKIWEGLIGEPATFGCAMLNDEDAAELFAAAYIGMPIHVTN